MYGLMSRKFLFSGDYPQDLLENIYDNIPTLDQKFQKHSKTLQNLFL